jgi:hypothetical protein
MIDVDEIDAGGLDPDENLAWARRGDRHVLQPQHLGSASGVNANRLHLRSRSVIAERWQLLQDGLGRLRRDSDADVRGGD